LRFGGVFGLFYHYFAEQTGPHRNAYIIVAISNSMEAVDASDGTGNKLQLEARLDHIVRTALFLTNAKDNYPQCFPSNKEVMYHIHLPVSAQKERELSDSFFFGVALSYDVQVPFDSMELEALARLSGARECGIMRDVRIHNVRSSVVVTTNTPMSIMAEGREILYEPSTRKQMYEGLINSVIDTARIAYETPVKLGQRFFQSIEDPAILKDTYLKCVRDSAGQRFEDALNLIEAEKLRLMRMDHTMYGIVESHSRMALESLDQWHVLRSDRLM
jgi:hypothetical protein